MAESKSNTKQARQSTNLSKTKVKSNNPRSQPGKTVPQTRTTRTNQQKEALVLTKTQLREILAAAGINQENSKESFVSPSTKDSKPLKQSTRQRQQLQQQPTKEPKQQRQVKKKGAANNNNNKENGSRVGESSVSKFPDNSTFVSSSKPSGVKTCPAHSPIPKTHSRNSNSDDSSCRILSAAPAAPSASPPPDPPRMSLIEQKRIQWAKERAQMQVTAEWNPWGRPGCGAPISVGTGNRNPAVVEWSPVSANKGSLNNSTTSLRATTNGEPSRTLLLPPLPQTAPMNNNNNKKVPSALRTSIAFGWNSENNDAVYLSAKEEEKRKWLEELDRQREEQRRRKLMEQEAATAASTSLIDQVSPSSLSSSSASRLRASPSQLPPMSDLNSLHANDPDDGNENGQRTYLRGANIPMDPEMKAELEKKRQKQKEQQMAIEAQLQEKQKRKMEEKRKLQMEEQAEEKRISRDRKFMEEQKRLEEDKFRQKVQGNPAESNPKQDEESSCSPAPMQQEQETAILLIEAVAADVVAEVLDPPPDQLEAVDSQPTHQVEERRSYTPLYVANRVLTPTKYRGSESEFHPPRDCATQTDEELTRTKDVGTEADANKKSKNSNKTNKKGDKQDNKPKWGAHQPDKTYLKQSEKDPRYEGSRRRLQEMRRKRLEHEAALQAGQPLVGRTRSSAKHQRPLLASEGNSPVKGTASMDSRATSPIVCPPRLSMSAEMYDDGTLDSSFRRQRRQWGSPSNDEIPNFYTQPLQLPARRTSRCSSRPVTGGSPTDTNGYQQQPLKANHDIYVVHHPSSSSPPHVLSTWNSESDLVQDASTSPPIPTLSNKGQSLEDVYLQAAAAVAENSRLTASAISVGNREDDAKQISRPTDDKRYLGSSKDRNHSALNNVDKPSSSSTKWPQRSKLLQQLSEIRQGLVKKQLELEAFLDKQRNESTEKVFIS